ncbi:hypothetical protein FM106_26285 [Brachybacterium faecium]|nr:hypothetical protein FM106_26285 [Brachybacterium faecium]
MNDGGQERPPPSPVTDCPRCVGCTRQLPRPRRRVQLRAAHGAGSAPGTGADAG